MNYARSLGWIFGSLVFAAGLVNTFWGNDPEFGIFLILMSLVYFPPASSMIDSTLKRVAGFQMPRTAKILLAIFLVWAALGVGELFDKLEMMKESLR